MDGSLSEREERRREDCIERVDENIIPSHTSSVLAINMNTSLGRDSRPSLDASSRLLCLKDRTLGGMQSTPQFASEDRVSLVPLFSLGPVVVLLSNRMVFRIDSVFARAFSEGYINTKWRGCDPHGYFIQVISSYCNHLTCTYLRGEIGIFSASCTQSLYQFSS